MKRKTIKKVASVIATTMLATTILAGCGGKDDSGASADAGAATQGGTTDAGTTDAGTTDAGTTDAAAVTTSGDGKTAYDKIPGSSITVMTYDRGNLPDAEGDHNENRWTTWIRENAPVEEIEWIAIPKSEAPEKMALMFAGGEAPDVLPNYESLSTYYQNGNVMEITDEMLAKMPNYSMLLEKYPIMVKSGSVDGQMVYFTKFSNIMPNHTMVVRKDWMDNLGLSDPKTPEDLYDMIYKFTYEDPDQNGADDTWGINLTTDAQRVLAHMYGFGNPAKYYMDENGELVYAWDRIESWLTFCKQIVDNKCVNPDFMTMKGDDDQADFLNGKIGIYCSGRFTNASRLTLFTNFKKNFPDATLDTFPLPATEYGQYTAYANGGASNVGFLNVDCKDVDASLAYVDWLYDAEVSEYLFYGEDGVYNKKDEYGTYTVVDSEKNANEYDWASDYNIIKNELLDGGSSGIGRHANDFYNIYLASDDPVLQEFGVLYLELFEIANDVNTPDPRKWLNDGLPTLPSDLALISTTGEEEVNALLKAGIADSAQTAAQIVQAAKDAWYGAGGEQVDAYYNDYYKTAGDSALLMDDFTNCKDPAELTPAAQANYDKLTK